VGIAVTALAVTAAAQGGEAKATKQVTVGDHGTAPSGYFTPRSVTIHRGSSVNWTWAADSALQHGVYVTKAPKRVDKSRYRSDVQGPPAEFHRKFTKPGVYRFICPIHSAIMHMKVTVKG
jgi:plastocyanin